MECEIILHVQVCIVTCNVLLTARRVAHLDKSEYHIFANFSGEGEGSDPGPASLTAHNK